MEFKEIENAVETGIPIYVFEPTEEQYAVPTIIYIPLLANKGYSSFDPMKNIEEGGYCGTFKLSMEADQVEELAGLMKFNITTCKQTLQNTVFSTLQRLNPDLCFLSG